MSANSLPNEILTMIFIWAVEHPDSTHPRANRIPLSRHQARGLRFRQDSIIDIGQVNRRWRNLARARLWQRFDVEGDENDYPIVLDLLLQFLGQPGDPHTCWTLDLEFNCSQRMPHRVLQDVVIPYGRQLRILDMVVDDHHLHTFFHLPPDTFPQLDRLTFVCQMENPNEEWHVCLPDDTTRTAIAQLAPRLSSFAISITNWVFCEGKIDLISLGLNLPAMRSLEIRIPVPEESLYRMLPLLEELERCAFHLDVHAAAEHYTFDDESDDEWGSVSGIWPIEDDDDDAPEEEESNFTAQHAQLPDASRISLTSITHLELVFSRYPSVTSFLHHFHLPFLTSLTLNHQGESYYSEHNNAFHTAFMEYFRRFGIRLTRLKLINVYDMWAEQLMDLLEQHRRFELELVHCQGNFEELVGGDEDGDEVEDEGEGEEGVEEEEEGEE
ncbi:hypothetical protein R3P38DRAFT_874228 [Favolaschia claudopus]|uniref:F-box domain-containing protein n=1 Tax=Favolaschia claudopus TaxID=2862362 RepID=A0AAV9Z0F6_9AGAR